MTTITDSMGPEFDVIIVLQKKKIGLYKKISNVRDNHELFSLTYTNLLLCEERSIP